MAYASWRIEGDWIKNCNSALGVMTGDGLGEAIPVL